MRKFSCIFMVASMLILSSCGGGGETPSPVNSNPVINSLTSTIQTVLWGKSVKITCLATDLENDVLLYTWNASGGTCQKDGNSIFWQAPNALGNYTITCIVSDGNNGSASKSIVITVRDTIPPIISNVSATPLSLRFTGGDVIITATINVESSIVSSKAIIRHAGLPDIPVVLVKSGEVYRCAWKAIANTSTIGQTENYNIIVQAVDTEGHISSSDPLIVIVQAADIPPSSPSL